MAEDNTVGAAGATFGTAAAAEPITRADFERALRFLNASDVDLRDTLLRLAAQVVALTDELVRRIDHVEPQPAAPGTPAAPASATVEEVVADAVPATLAKIHAADERFTPRVWIETDAQDKYNVRGPDIPCGELIHLCHARCCTFEFPLSTFDLDEGVIRWDYGRPYVVRQRASDRKCVHNDPATHYCTVHSQRPLVCRAYDCRTDKRVWLDFEQRVLAPEHVPDDPAPPFDLMDRVRRRAQALLVEDRAVVNAFPAAAPERGPVPTSGGRMHPPRP